jgi:hypothetical protein
MISGHGRKSDIAKEKDPVTGVKWGDVIKKEARGSDDADLGEIQDVDQTYVITQRGNINREKYFLPKNLVERYQYYVSLHNSIHLLRTCISCLMLHSRIF